MSSPPKTLCRNPYFENDLEAWFERVRVCGGGEDWEDIVRCLQCEEECDVTQWERRRERISQSRDSVASSSSSAGRDAVSSSSAVGDVKSSVAASCSLQDINEILSHAPCQACGSPTTPVQDLDVKVFHCSKCDTCSGVDDTSTAEDALELAELITHSLDNKKVVADEPCTFCQNDDVDKFTFAENVRGELVLRCQVCGVDQELAQDGETSKDAGYEKHTIFHDRPRKNHQSKREREKKGCRDFRRLSTWRENMERELAKDDDTYKDDHKKDTKFYTRDLFYGKGKSDHSKDVGREKGGGNFRRFPPRRGYVERKLAKETFQDDYKKDPIFHDTSFSLANDRATRAKAKERENWQNVTTRPKTTIGNSRHSRTTSLYGKGKSDQGQGESAEKGGGDSRRFPPPISHCDIFAASELSPGDHIFWVRPWFYEHHAIVVAVADDEERIEVIQYSRPTNGGKGVVERSWLNLSEKAEPLCKVLYTRCHRPDEVTARAKSRLGENTYSLVTNNCEHFARWCKTGVARSGQVDYVTSKAATVGIGVIGHLASRGSQVAQAASLMTTGLNVAEEVFSAARDIHTCYTASQRGEITKREFVRCSVKRGVTGAVRLGFTAAGAALGNMVCPGIGGLIGMTVGEVIGNHVGKVVGRQVVKWFS